MRIGIYGGSFSPPHLGHVSAALAFAEAVAPDKLLIVPSLIPPHKSIEESVSASHRFEMCRIAFENDLRFGGVARVSDYEMINKRISYTYLTLRHFAGLAEKIYLLIGTDMLLAFEKWKNFQEIFDTAAVCFAERRENSAARRAQTNAVMMKYRTDYGAEIIRLEYDQIEISSSELRMLLEGGKSCAGYLSPEVEEYIRSRGLYGAKNV